MLNFYIARLRIAIFILCRILDNDESFFECCTRFDFAQWQPDVDEEHYQNKMPVVKELQDAGTAKVSGNYFHWNCIHSRSTCML